MSTHASPGVYSKITDKSGYMPTNLIAGFFAIAPIFSSRGEDNKIKFKTSDLDAISEFGEPSFSKYGFPYNVAVRWLEGGSQAQMCRLLPNDAKYANIALSIDAKAPTRTPASTFSGLILPEVSYPANQYGVYANEFYKNTSASAVIGFNETDWVKVSTKFVSASSYAINDVVIYNSALYKATSAVPANTGWVPASWSFIGEIHSLSNVVTVNAVNNTAFASKSNIDAFLATESNKTFMVFRAIGRGSSYNSLSMTLELDASLAETYNFKVYNLQLFDVDTNGFKVTTENVYKVSFDKDALDLSGESMFIADVVNKYSELVRVDVNMEILEDKLVDVANTLVDIDASILDIFELDFLGATLSSDVKFAQGSEGSLIGTNGRIVPSVRDDLLIDFFTGLIDSRILNFKDVPAKIVFDANYSNPVKTVLSAFTDTLRTDVFALLSSGFQANETQELTFRSESLTIDNRAASLFSNNYEVYDRFSGKYIKVPSIYDVVYNVSKSFNQNGVHIAVAGFNSRGLISGVKPYSLAYNPPLAYTDQFYLKQINPIVKDPTGIYIMGMLTTQKKASALQNMPVVNMLQVMDVELAMFCQQYLFEQLTTEVMDDLRNKINDYFVKWYNNRGIESVNVSVYASALDKKNKQVKIDIEIVPTSFIEKILLNFIVK